MTAAHNEPARSTQLLDVGTDHTLALVVSRAWSSEDYLARLVADPKQVLADEGYAVSDDIDLRVLVDTPQLTHVAVTRQTSNVEDLARELATRFPIPDNTEIRLVQSSDAIRYLILPVKPEGLSAIVDAELGMLNTKPDDTANTETNVETAAEAVTAAVEAATVATEAVAVVVLT